MEKFTEIVRQLFEHHPLPGIFCEENIFSVDEAGNRKSSPIRQLKAAAEKIWKNILIIAIQERFHPIYDIFKEVISFSIWSFFWGVSFLRIWSVAQKKLFSQQNKFRLFSVNRCKIQIKPFTITALRKPLALYIFHKQWTCFYLKI